MSKLLWSQQGGKRREAKRHVGGPAARSQMHADGLQSGTDLTHLGTMPHVPAGTERGGSPNYQERGWLTRGKDFRLGSEDELALVRHPGRYTLAP